MPPIQTGTPAQAPYTLRYATHMPDLDSYWPRNRLILLVTVTDREKHLTETGPRDCFVVQSDYAKAWVDERGVVHEQQIELPIVGTLRIVRQSEYDQSAYARAKKLRVHGRSEPR